MENYKIKVNNEAESKEAQDLFEQLGFKWAVDHLENGDWYSHLYAENSTCCYLSPYVWVGLADRFKEITLSKLRDLVAQKQGLISGADALRALADGEEVQCTITGKNEWTKDIYSIQPYYFVGGGVGQFQFRIKPRTVKIELEIPAPFEPKDGDKYYRLAPIISCGYTECYSDEDCESQFGAWRTESEIKQVVAALRGGIKG